MKVKEWLIKTYKPTEGETLSGIFVRGCLECNDGFTMSVQASRAHYCAPKALLPDCDYTHVEAGFTSDTEGLLAMYKAGGIYPYVPIEVIDQVIRKHGGIKE